MNVNTITLHLMSRYPTIVAVLLLFSTMLYNPVAAQTASSNSDEWEAPQTLFGHPDLQGNWTNVTLTPLQRPATLGPILTRQQVIAIESGQSDFVADAATPSDPNRAPPTGGNDPICIDGATTCYNEAWRDPGENVATVNGEPRSSLITNPPDGLIPAFTQEGRRRLDEFSAQRSSFGEFDHPELRPLSERCIVSFGSSAGPPMLPNGWYNNNYSIVQNPDYVMIIAEMVHDVRIIRLGEPTSLPEDIRPWFGVSWGHWEGNTLVVETTNMNLDHWFEEAPPSKGRKVTERFTRVDEETIHYQFTIDDPALYTSVWGGDVPFKALNDRLYEYACHEGNYAFPNILSGARHQESAERHQAAN